MTKLIAECSFDFDGKTYEYELKDVEQLRAAYPPHGWPGYEEGFILTTYTDLYAVTEKANPGEESPTPSPKEFGLVRVRRIKLWADKVFDGNLKKINHLFFRVIPLLAILPLGGCLDPLALASPSTTPAGRYHASLSQDHLARSSSHEVRCDPRWLTCDRLTPAERNGGSE